MLPHARWSCFLVKPQTLLRWHRRLVAGAWTYPHRRPGQPWLDTDVERLIVRLAREHPRWSDQRIQGELLRLGVQVSATAIGTTLRRHRLDPAPRPNAVTWRALLCQQAAGIVACDLLHRRYRPAAPTVGAVLHRIAHPTDPPGRRDRQPDGAWAQQARTLLVLGERGRRLRFLVRDRDAKVCRAFDDGFRSEASRCP